MTDFPRRRGRPPRSLMPEVATVEDPSVAIAKAQIAQAEKVLSGLVDIRVTVEDVHIGDGRIGYFGDVLPVTPEIADFLVARRQVRYLDERG